MGTEWKRERNGRGLWYEASEKGIVGISDAYVRERKEMGGSHSGWN